MKIRPAFLLIALLVTACQTLDSGFEGSVTIGPMCPVMQEGIPCPDQPYQAELTILTESGKKVMQLQTDEDGSFRIELAVGDYVLHPESPGGLPFAPDLPFSVEEHQFTHLEVIYDSGIR
jgi:hypothetical protein